MPLWINQEKVDEAVIELEAESLRAHFRQLTPEQQAQWGLDADGIEKRAREWSRENVIERTLLRQEALKDAEPVPAEAIETALAELKKRQGGETQFNQTHPDSDQLREDIETRIRLDRLVSRIGAKAPAPKLKEIAEYYRKHREQFRVPEMIRAAHIVKNVDEHRDEPTAAAEIQQVAEELRAGASFEELADKHSDCPGNGGDLGYFARGRMVDEFDDAVFTMEIGGVTPVFRTQFGFHVARLIDRQPARLRPLSEVEEEIKADLHRQKKNRAVENFVDQLRAKADIQDAPEAEIARKVSRS